MYSTTLESVSSARTRIERTFDPDTVRKLKAEADHDLTVDGLNLAAQAIAPGLVDEYHLFITTSVVGGRLCAPHSTFVAWRIPTLQHAYSQATQVYLRCREGRGPATEAYGRVGFSGAFLPGCRRDRTRGCAGGAGRMWVG